MLVLLHDKSIKDVKRNDFVSFAAHPVKENERTKRGGKLLIDYTLT